jgi:hypothetical protein
MDLTLSGIGPADHAAVDASDTFERLPRGSSATVPASASGP